MGWGSFSSNKRSPTTITKWSRMAFLPAWKGRAASRNSTLRTTVHPIWTNGSRVNSLALLLGKLLLDSSEYNGVETEGKWRSTNYERCTEWSPQTRHYTSVAAGVRSPYNSICAADLVWFTCKFLQVRHQISRRRQFFEYIPWWDTQGWNT